MGRMIRSPRGSMRLSFFLILLLTAGFAATSLISYLSSRQSIHDGIALQELPLTGDNVYSQIQKDLVRPVFVSSMMATDTFLRHWVLQGELDPTRIAQYLTDVKARFGAVTTFFVSDKTHRYYYPDGILKIVRTDEPRDLWFWRVRTMAEPYETNVDPDLSRHDELTIFINYRVFDFEGRFLGAAGIGLTVESMKDFVRRYQTLYRRRVYFVDRDGRVSLSADSTRPTGADLKTGPFPWSEIKTSLPGGIVSLEYRDGAAHYLASARYIPELKWYLVVEKDDDQAMEGIQSVLWLNLALCLGVTAVVVGLFWVTAGGYQRRLELQAWTDPLTGLANRQALDAGLSLALRKSGKTGERLVLGIVDADHFKSVNDRHGHAVGDGTLRDLAGLLSSGIREDDLVGRWGGEEFLVLLRHCGSEDGKKRFFALMEAVDNGPWTEPDTAVTVSIGVASLEASDTVSSWLARADEALYRAKDAGRHRVEVAGELS
jgi:diguanylate cyclase (GGDEF)-like protein